MAADELKQELDQYLAAHPETRYLETLSVDMNGILRGKRAQRDDFYKLFQNGMNLCAATAILDSRGNTFETIPFGIRDGDPDVKSMAVAGSLAPVPWVRLPTAQVLVENFTFTNEQQNPLIAEVDNKGRKIEEVVAILAPLGIKVGDRVVASENADIVPGAIAAFCRCARL